ncbi:MAG TPA: transposase [Thermoanaerobaculia bacterium]|nr:transposase [Thermoanaerobaculia bacterium]
MTCRTVQSRLLLTPRAHVQEIVLGVLARAKRMYPLDLIVFAFASNHFHLLIWVEDAGQMSAFMGYLNGNLARELGRLADWKERFWGRRYQSIPVSDEEGAQIARLKYILSHGAKEGLVADPREWPGAHAVHALLSGEPVVGVWYDRTQEYRYRLRGKEPEPRQFATEEVLTLAPLPCWRHLPPEEYRRRMVDLVAEIVEEARVVREAKGTEPLGADMVRRQQPHTRPNRTKKSPAPLFHTASKRAYLALREAYSRFVAAFRDASEKLRAGDRLVEFPEGSFPPALPFVRRATAG